MKQLKYFHQEKNVRLYMFAPSKLFMSYNCYLYFKFHIYSDNIIMYKKIYLFLYTISKSIRNYLVINLRKLLIYIYFNFCHYDTYKYITTYERT